MIEMLILGVLVAASIGLVIYSVLPSRTTDSEHMRRRMAGRRADRVEAMR